jgi:hypothetical protein
MREVPHFSEHKSRAIGTQTPSHFLCQEKTHQDAYWKSVGPSGSFGRPSHKKKNKSLSFSASLDSLARSLARSHLLLTDKPCTKVNIITRKRGDTIILSLLLSFRVIPLPPSFTRRANTHVLHSNNKKVEKSTYESIIK